MIFETHSPDAKLAKYIESIFHFKGFQPDHSVERVVPTGHVFLIFELDGFKRSVFDNVTLEPVAHFKRAWVSGNHRKYISISAHDDSEMFVVQFKAYGAYPFLHESMATLADRVVPATEILDGDLIELRTRLYSATTSGDKFAVIDDWLLSQFDQTREPPNAIVDVAIELQSEPAAKLKEIVDAFPATQKHLIEQFKKYVGLTPKHYQRILRFNDVFAQMQNDQFLSWSDIAYRCGYSDQSHFIREFRHFSGFNPKKFLQEDFGDDATNFFPLDRDG